MLLCYPNLYKGEKYNIDLTETNFKDMRNNELYDNVTDGELLIVANEWQTLGILRSC